MLISLRPARIGKQLVNYEADLHQPCANIRVKVQMALPIHAPLRVSMSVLRRLTQPRSIAADNTIKPAVPLYRCTAVVKAGSSAVGEASVAD